jgi:pimeloyl-ACP methyl ester carboxylesterase
VEFIQEIIKHTKITKPPVIVLPSMGGGFGLPFIMKDPEKAHKRISGIIAIAPVGTNIYTHDQFHRILVSLFKAVMVISLTF